MEWERWRRRPGEACESCRGRGLEAVGQRELFPSPLREGRWPARAALVADRNGTWRGGRRRAGAAAAVFPGCGGGVQRLGLASGLGEVISYWWSCRETWRMSTTVGSVLIAMRRMRRAQVDSKSLMLGDRAHHPCVSCFLRGFARMAMVPRRIRGCPRSEMI